MFFFPLGRKFHSKSSQWNYTRWVGKIVLVLVFLPIYTFMSRPDVKVLQACMFTYNVQTQSFRNTINVGITRKCITFLLHLSLPYFFRVRRYDDIILRA